MSLRLIDYFPAQPAAIVHSLSLILPVAFSMLVVIWLIFPVSFHLISLVWTLVRRIIMLPSCTWTP